MAELTDTIRDWLTARHQAILITRRRDGSAQSSNIITAFDGEAFRVSVTATRAKTRNLARDARATMHVLGEDFWHYASVRCTAELGPVSRSAADQAGRDLLDLYNTISPTPHPDPDEFYRTMVADERLLLTLRPVSVAGTALRP